MPAPLPNAPVTEASAYQRIGNAQAILLDWDGCVALDDVPTPGAIRFLKEFQNRLAIVSNNSTNLPEDFADLLRRAGCYIPPDRIFLAGAEALAHAARIGTGRTMLLGNRRMEVQAELLGILLDDRAPDTIVLMRDTGFSFARLQAAANAVAGGARLIVSNADRTHPGVDGGLVPETGALLAALTACAPDAVFEVIGKPSPLLFHRACESLGAAPRRAIMIGDNPDTDIRGARALGMDALLIGPAGELPALAL
ncbi:MAG: HAD-IA family hydrolase [Pseudomonadota bacterium]